MLFTAAFGALALFLFKSGLPTSASSISSPDHKSDAAMTRISDSSSPTKNKFQVEADERRSYDRRIANMKGGEKDWYGGGLWLRSKSPLKKDHMGDVHGFESTMSQDDNDQEKTLEKEKQQVVSIHEAIKEEMTTAKKLHDLRNGGLWKKDELPQLLNAVLEMEEGNFYKYNVPYDAVQGEKEEDVARPVLQQKDSSRSSGSGGNNEKKTVRGPRVGREMEKSVPRKDSSVKDSSPFSFNSHREALHKDQWHIAPRAGKDVLEATTSNTDTKDNTKGIGHIGGSIWTKKDGGLWAKKDGGLWARENDGLWVKKDGGLWAKNGVDLWSKKDGGLWSKKDGGLWARKDGGLWARKDGLLAKRENGGIWLWRNKDRSLSEIFANKMGS